MGKNKVMAVAFGRDESDEYQDNMAGVGKVFSLCQLLCVEWASLPAADEIRGIRGVDGKSDTR